MTELKILKYTPKQTQEPTTLAYSLGNVDRYRNKYLVLYALSNNQGQTIGDNLIGIFDTIVEKEQLNSDDVRDLRCRMQCGEHFFSSFYIVDIPHGGKRVMCGTKTPFSKEDFLPQMPAHLRLQNTTQRYQEMLDAGEIELVNIFQNASSDNSEHNVVALPHADSDITHDGYVFATSDYAGMNHSHPVLVPTDSLIEYLREKDSGMLEHADRKLEGRSVYKIISRHNFVKPLNTGVWSYNPVQEVASLSVGDASIIRVFEQARIPFFPLVFKQSVPQADINIISTRLHRRSIRQV